MRRGMRSAPAWKRTRKAVPAGAEDPKTPRAGQKIPSVPQVARRHGGPRGHPDGQVAGAPDKPRAGAATVAGQAGRCKTRHNERRTGC